MEFQLLGDLQASHEGRRIALGGHRQRCVLAVLLLDPGRVVPVDRIVARAWPADSPETAAELVTSYVSRLRKTLGGTGQIDLVSRRPGYLAQIDRELIDAHRFSRMVRQARRDREGLDSERAAARLRGALDLWHGSALADLDSPWFANQRSRLEQARLDAFEDLVEIELSADRAGDIIAQARDMAEAHPERERLSALTVRALDSVGESAQAADFAARMVRTLHKMGLEAGPALLQAQRDALAPKTAERRVRTSPGRAQLPPDTSAFTGRRADLDAVIALVGDGRTAETVVTVAIDGMAGIGKTTFAIHAAHRLAAHFPDGQLFIDLHGFTSGAEPVRPEAALDRILRTMGVAPQHVPLDPDERAALYRARLAATRTLIVLDNAASAAQIRPLLPGAPGCLVLITSRRQLTGLDDAHAIRLDVLSDAEAISLFTAVAGPGRVSAGDAALMETIALCGNIPLAIRIAAARLRTRPTWPAHYLADRLRDETERLTQLDDGDRSLTAALAVSYDHLTVEEQRIFRHLGLHPGVDTDLFAAAALAGRPLKVADALLEALVSHNLLAHSASGRYQFHDLVRIYAQTRLDGESAEDRREALDRLFDYYLYTARRADQRLSLRTVKHAFPVARVPSAAPDLDTDMVASAWVDSERTNLVAIADYASAHGHTAHAIELPAAMHGALRIQGYWILSDRLQRVAIAAARRADDLGAAARRGMANALCCLGDIYTVTGNYTQAVDTFTDALEIYQGIKDRLGEANAWAALASLHRFTAHFAQATATLERALVLYRRLGDALGQADALTTLGDVQKLTGQYEEAQATLENAFILYARSDHRHGQAQVLTDLGRVQELTGQDPKAMGTLAEALDLYRRLGNRIGQAGALACIGSVQQSTGEPAAAVKTLNQALDLFHQLGNRLGQADALAAIGAAQYAQQQYEAAHATLEQAVNLCRQIGHRLGQADALTLIVSVQRAMGRLQDADESYRQALDIYQQIDSDL